ncbi:MAG: hypothetical protein AAFQ98_11415 [Bacteroidota bacterium]
MKILIIILACIFSTACMAFTLNPELTPHAYEGTGSAEYTIPLDELGDLALLEWNSKTWMGYHAMEITDEEGNRLRNHWGFGILYFAHEKTLDLSELKGESLIVTIKGNRRTQYSFSLTPVTE